MSLSRVDLVATNATPTACALAFAVAFRIAAGYATPSANIRRARTINDQATALSHVSPLPSPSPRVCADESDDADGGRICSPRVCADEGDDTDGGRIYSCVNGHVVRVEHWNLKSSRGVSELGSMFRGPPWPLERPRAAVVLRRSARTWCVLGGNLLVVFSLTNM